MIAPKPNGSLSSGTAAGHAAQVPHDARPVDRIVAALARLRPGARRDASADVDPPTPVALAERIGARSRVTVVAADPGKAPWRRALR